MVTIHVDPPQTDKWGEFEVRKTYNVSPPTAFGYVVQRVSKQTTLIVHHPDKAPETLTTSSQISEFTSNQVNNASDTYYELFPILNGTTCDGEPELDRSNCIDDQFQNGAMLRYEAVTRNRRGKTPLVEYYADDEPATSGTIEMIGTNVFVPTSEAVARDLYTRIQSGAGGTWKASPTDVEWDLSPSTPANGLPYRSSFQMPTGPNVIHNVKVRWDQTGTTTISQHAGRRLTRARAASRLYRTRRTGRATRRSRGQA